MQAEQWQCRRDSFLRPSEASLSYGWGRPSGFQPSLRCGGPGVWVLGDLSDADRGHGMGIVVEYAGRSGEPQWVKPEPFRWDYARFGKAGTTTPAPDEAIEMTLAKQNAAANGFNLWTINGEAFSMEAMKPM
jgi:hypothetical protein